MVTIAALKVFLDSLEEGVLFLDARRRVVQINAAAERLLGGASDRLIGSLCPTLFVGTQCAGECEVHDSCSLTPKPGEMRKIQDVMLKRADGGEMALRMWAMLLPPNNAGLYCSIVLRDRTREVALENEVRERWQLGGLIGHAPAMQSLYAQILRAAASDASVLISGESGVGKELVARALHDNSPRSAGPYVPLNCAALPETLLESELFGHAKGAFSGAAIARVGRFEASNGGTLMLDEIGEISAAMQTKLLRVLQEREVVRLGENHARKVDVRVVAATNRDLAAMARRGEFREDLYYRLRVLPLHVAPLRERREDIALLTTKIMDELAERYRRAPLRITREAMAVLEACAWPGNVRQLYNALEFAMVHADGPVMLPRHLPPEILRPPVLPIATAQQASPFTHYYRPPVSPDEERRLIHRAIDEAGGNRAEAARRLGMSRTTLWKRLKA
ncbi:MAG TPA: sigma 54-interacting transcriptional regulator [Burkholderiales bacterium]|jgi:PAS domain S-box